MNTKVLLESENLLKRGKKFYIGLFDYLSMFIIIVILFMIFIGIYQSSAKYKNMVTNINEYEHQLADISASTKLTYLEEDEDGNLKLVSMERVAINYVYSQIYTSFLNNNDERINDSLFEGVLKADENNDPCFYYINTYRITNKEKYTLFNEDINGNYYLTKIKTNNGIYDSNTYPIITYEAAKIMFASLKDTSEDSTLFDITKSNYLEMVKELVTDFIENNTTYIVVQNEYSDTYSNLYRNYIYALIIIYLVTSLIIYFVIPCINKDGRTLFMRLFRLTRVSYDKKDVETGQIIINYLCSFIIYLFTPLLVLLISFDITSFVDIMFVSFFKFFNMFTLGTLSFIFMICNMIFTFYSKKKKQTISEFLSRIITVEDKRIKTIDIGLKSFEIE